MISGALISRLRAVLVLLMSSAFLRNRRLRGLYALPAVRCRCARCRGNYFEAAEGFRTQVICNWDSS